MKIKLLLLTLALPISVAMAQVYLPNITPQPIVANGTNHIGVGTNIPVNPIQIEGTVPELSLLIWNKGTNGARTYLTSSPGRSSIHTDKDFAILTNYGGWSDKFVLTHAGNVGIGTSIPVNPIQIEGTLPDMNLLVWNKATNGARTYLTSSAGKSSIKTDKDFAIMTNSGGWSDKFFLSYGGNVGIGTSIPMARLHSVGSIYSSATRTNTIFSGTVGSNNANFIGSEGYWALRTATNNSFNLDVFNSSQPRVALTVLQNGYIGMGTTSPDANLTVAGNIHSREVKVTVNAGADYVFNDDYKLISLSELDKFIKVNKHLPEIQSAKEMEEEGLELGKMDIKLLQKIEELTLYMIEFNKKIETLEIENGVLKKRIAELDKK